MVSAPLSVASGCIGLSQYAAYLVPALPGIRVAHAGLGQVVAVPGTVVAVAAVGLAVAMLYRNLASLQGGESYVLWCTVIGTIAWVLVTARAAWALEYGVRCAGGSVCAGETVLYGAGERDADCDL